MVLGSPSRKVPKGRRVNYEGMEITVPCYVGLQISSDIYNQVSSKSDLWQVKAKNRWHHKRFVSPKPHHIHLLLSIPPRFSVANTVGFIKGKSAIRIHRELLGTKRMTGLSFWATGYCASTVGLDEEMIKQYIQNQDKFNKDNK